MGRALRLGAVMCAILLFAAAARSDVAADTSLPPLDDPSVTVAEPITGTAIQPAPGSETIQKDPFAPYDVGGPDAIWPYEALSPDEQALVDGQRDAAKWQGVHDAYGQAVRQRSALARSEAAQHELGLDGELADTGVVP